MSCGMLSISSHDFSGTWAGLSVIYCLKFVTSSSQVAFYTMMQALLIALTSILLFPSSAIPSALPSSSSLSEPFLISPSTNNLALPAVAMSPEAEDGIACFNLTTEHVRPVDVSDCNEVIDSMLHDPSDVMKIQNFSHNHEIPGVYAVPKIWEWGRCCILLTSEHEDAVAKFRLVDAIMRAQEVIAKCPPNSKASLGGIAVLGIETFFVAIDGPPRLVGPNQTMQLGA